MSKFKEAAKELFDCWSDKEKAYFQKHQERSQRGFALMAFDDYGLERPANKDQLSFQLDVIHNELIKLCDDYFDDGLPRR